MVLLFDFFNSYALRRTMNFVCPDSPVWSRGHFSTCFENMVLGTAPNLVTITMIFLLGYRVRGHRQGTRVTRVHNLEKLFSSVIPVLGAFLSLCNIVLLVNETFQGHDPGYHHWFQSCSESMLWMTILLFLNCDNWILIFCNQVFCFWWFMKVLLEVSHLWTVFSSLETIRCLIEGSLTFVEIMLGIFLNLIRLVPASSTRKIKVDYLEEGLLQVEGSSEESHANDWSFDFLGLFHYLTFKEVNQMMDLGVTKQLDFQDLIELPEELMVSSCCDTLLRCWEAEHVKHCQNASLFRTICCAYGWPYLRLGLLKALNDAINFVGPLLLNRLIRFLQQGSDHLDGYLLAISLGLSSILKSFLDTQYSFILMKLKLKLRASVMAIVYRKCLHVSLAERSKFSDGEIQTFMSIDVDRTINLCNSFHDLWSLPVQIGVALYLLYSQVKFAFVSGLAITILLIPVNKWISTLIASATEKMMSKKDERIRSVGELLSHIQTVKMYSWECLFANRIIEKRSMEVKHLTTRKYLDAWCVFFWATTPTLFSLFTFGVFTLMGHPLDAATVFTCVALFNILISPLNSFPWVINGLIDAFISTRRLSKFLSCWEYGSRTKAGSKEDVCRTIDVPNSIVEDNVYARNNEMAIIFREADFVWSSREDNTEDIFLKQLNLDLPKGFLIVVIGEVGSGKSSLLYSVLREMRQIHGYVDSLGSIAYVAQIPWIMSGTVRDNILFGKEYDARRYREVVHACSLDVDISLMIGGDMSYIGEKGSNLSGGQRTRLALARALYQDPDILLLDDILSAVDAHVGCWILQQAILGPLMRKTTRVLCSHNSQVISAADMVIYMDKGHVKWAGCLENFVVSPYSSIFVENDKKLFPSQIIEQSSGYMKPLLSPEGGHIAVSEETPEISEEMRKEGKVEFDVYKNYATFCSWPIVIILCVSAVLMQASRNGNDMWLSFWVDTTNGTKESAKFYLVIMCIFCVVNSLLTLVRAFSFSYGGLRAATKVHSELLRNLIDAPVYFFNQNPSGRILNRLSSDLYTIDDSLPFILNILFSNFFNLVGIAIVLSYAQVLFLLLLFPLWYIYQKLQFYYRSTSRELRRLDSVSRSPIYSSFSETLDGSPTMRAFEAEEFFMSGFNNHVALYQQTSYSELTASLWLSLRLQLLASVIISAISLLAVFGCGSSFPIRFGTPGLVGLALSYSAPVVSLLSSFLTSFTETEKEMVSVERVLQYMDIPQEELQGSRSLYPVWPTKGQIEFENVTLKYMPSSPAALSDVSFKITAGSQVGVVGRTGAGKSSILNALFRLTPICNGRILVDELNIADIAVRDLRLHLAVVPQSPFLFEGSLRENLDPYASTTEEIMWDALKKCHVKEDIEAAGGLDVHVREAGISFSVGQRQLICLARAMIKSAKILCLDECTANVDAATTSILHNTISEECKEMTVITIAHRISVVTNMDNILVLDHGILVEQGNPHTLLKDGNSRFSSLARASTM